MRTRYDSMYSLISIVALMCVVLQSPATVFSQDTPKSYPWFQRSIVGMEVGPTGAQFGYSDPHDNRYCANWDGAAIVRHCVAANAEYLVLWLRDGDFAYYNSKLLPKAPGLNDRDPLQEALAEAARHDMPVISYCVVQQAGIFLQQNPQWRMRDSNGSEIHRFCYNSGYLEAMKQIVAEQLAYGIDGFHIDMLDQGFDKPYGCWCAACRKMFRSKYEHDMPSGTTWDTAWGDMLEFRYETSERFEKALTTHIKSLNPKATVDFNYHGSPPFSFEVGQRPVQHAGNAEFVTGETGAWGFSALGVGLNAEFYRAATPHRPFQVAIQRGVRTYHDQTTRPLNDMRWETFTLLAHGAFVTMIDKTAFDGSLDSVAYSRIGKVLGEARKKREHFGHDPVFDIGLYFSSRTRDWIGREDPSQYFHSFQGAHQVCAMEHLLFGVLLDENVTLETLQKFPVVCLPNVAIVSNKEVDLLRSYVRLGGKLLITGQSGQFDSLGRPREPAGVSTTLPQTHSPKTRSVLEELIGARAIERLESQDNWIHVDTPSNDPQTEALAADIQPDWPFLVKGPATVYEPTTATPFGKLYRPHRTNRQREGKMGTNLPMSADRPVGPAVLINSFGNGQVITCAGSPDYATASEYALVENRTLFRNLFRMLGTKRRVEINAPSNIEAIVTDDSDSRTLRIHLLAFNSTPRTTPRKNRPYVLPGLIEDKPIFRVNISADGVKEWAGLNPSTRIERDENDQNAIKATVEDIHEVILLKY